MPPLGINATQTWHIQRRCPYRDVSAVQIAVEELQAVGVERFVDRPERVGRSQARPDGVSTRE